MTSPAHPITAATPGTFALFEGGEYDEAVLAWDGDGRALVVDLTGRLSPAEDREGFDSINGDNLAPQVLLDAIDVFTM